MRNDMVTKVSLKCCLYAHADVVVPPLFCRLLINSAADLLSFCWLDFFHLRANCSIWKATMAAVNVRVLTSGGRMVVVEN
jgi:hypothetical protein